MEKFKDGDSVNVLVLPNESFYRVGANLGAEVGSIESITVVMENGQLGLVPWFVVSFSDRSFVKVNAAHVESVSMAAPA